MINAMMAALREFWPTWVALALKGTALLAVAWAVSLMLRRASSAQRHLVWSLAIAGLVLLPILVFLVPQWHVLPPQMNLAADQVILPESATAAPGPGVAVEAASAYAVADMPSASRGAAVPWQAWLVCAWLAGACMVWLPVLLGCFSLIGVCRSCTRADKGEWYPLVQGSPSAERALRRTVLLEGGRNSVPMVWGVLRPHILLPQGVKDMSTEERRATLLHELAHVSRWDGLTHLLSRTACALNWFNPLAWLAHRRMVTERERACDDAVMNAGLRAGDYAEQLVRMASKHRSPGLLLDAAAMARPSSLESRIDAILTQSGSRRPVGAARLAASVLLALALLIPMASLRPAQAAEKSPQKAQEAAQVDPLKAQMMGWVEDFFLHNARDVTARKTIEWGDVTTDADGNRSIRYKAMYTIWDKKKIIDNKVFTFDPKGQFVTMKRLEGFPQEVNPEPIDTTTKEGLIKLVEKFFTQNFRDITARQTVEWGEREVQPDGNVSIRYKYHATIWDKDKMMMNQIFTFKPNGDYVSSKNVEGFPQSEGVVPWKPVDTSSKESLVKLVEKFFTQNFRDITARETVEWGDREVQPDGNVSIRYKYIATIWGKDKKMMNQVFTFKPDGEFLSYKNVEGFPQPVNAGAGGGGR
jgi:beta-lactamase regulating signal transducer with metallopeptidase domain